MSRTREKHVHWNAFECFKLGIIKRSQPWEKSACLSVICVYVGTTLQPNMQTPEHARYFSNERLKLLLVCSYVKTLKKLSHGVRYFSPSRCGPISFLRLSLRRYYLGYSYSTSTYHIKLRYTSQYRYIS